MLKKLRLWRNICGILALVVFCLNFITAKEVPVEYRPFDKNNASFEKDCYIEVTSLRGFATWTRNGHVQSAYYVYEDTAGNHGIVRLGGTKSGRSDIEPPIKIYGTAASLPGDVEEKCSDKDAIGEYYLSALSEKRETKKEPYEFVERILGILCVVFIVLCILVLKTKKKMAKEKNNFPTTQP